jgi:hypothetical protein
MPGPGRVPGWQSTSKPIVISAARYAELAASGLGGAPDANGVIRGRSRDAAGTVEMPWALIPARYCRIVPTYRAACGDIPNDAYGVFFDESPKFKQQRVGGAEAVNVLNYDAVLGLVNPGQDDYGYKACVTGDYDLFSVWAPADVRHDRYVAGHGRQVDVRVVDAYKQANTPRGGQPPATSHFHQDYRLGNISGRLRMIKVALNTGLIAKGAYKGGNLVHHSDEIGNPSPGLRKTLIESLPLLSFFPRDRWAHAGLMSSGLCATNTYDFSQLVVKCRETGIEPTLRPEWSNFAV